MCINPPSPPVRNSGHVSGESVETIVYILTSGGRRIPAHATILASASPVFESIIDSRRNHRSSGKYIPILGVPCDAVEVFISFLYSNRCNEEQMEKFGIHLLALAHVYLVPELKRRCTKALIGRLTVENVVDVLQLARLCDAPDLYLKCMNVISNRFKSVEETEGWKFLQNNDPFLELEILKFIDEVESRRKSTRKHMQEQSLYFQLSEAMDCLHHICTEGCTIVRPYDKKPSKIKAPCSKFSTCEGLQHSIYHFANCKKRVSGGCVRCKRMWQLFKLHSSICESPDTTCKVPLCRQFKTRGTQVKNKKEEARWELLVKKVVAAKAISKLSLPKRKLEQQEHQPRSFRDAINCHLPTLRVWVRILKPQRKPKNFFPWTLLLVPSNQGLLALAQSLKVLRPCLSATKSLPYTEFNLDDVDSLFLSRPGKAPMVTPPSAPTKTPATRAKASAKRKRASDGEGSMNQLQKALYDHICEGFALVKNVYAQDSQSLEKDVFSLKSSLATKEKEVVKLTKQFQGAQEELMYTQAVVSEEIAEATAQAKIWAGKAVLEARLKMAQQALDPSFDKSSWPIAKWEETLASFGSKEEANQVEVQTPMAEDVAADEAGASGVQEKDEDVAATAG